jgi:hypothetical protein
MSSPPWSPPGTGRHMGPSMASAGHQHKLTHALLCPSEVAGNQHPLSRMPVMWVVEAHQHEEDLVWPGLAG